MASPKKLDHVLPEQSALPVPCFWCEELTIDTHHFTAFYKMTPLGWERVDMEICPRCASTKEFKRTITNAHYEENLKIYPYAKLPKSN